MIFLRGLANNPFTLQKVNGQNIPFKGLLHGNEITTFDIMLPLGVGDRVERTLPNGKVEHYLVRNPVFNSGIPPTTPAFYAIKVEMEGAKPNPHRVPAVTNVYNVQGPNARVNLNSVDSSSNIANVNESELFTKLFAAIESGILDATQKTWMLENAGALQKAIGTSSYQERFRILLAEAANCMTILTPFLPALSQLAASHLI